MLISPMLLARAGSLMASDSVPSIQISTSPTPPNSAGEMVVISPDTAKVKKTAGAELSSPQKPVETGVSASLDTLLQHPDSIPPRRDSTPHKPFLDDVITGQNEDSLVYKVPKKIVLIYEKGDVKYQKMNMKADFMRIDMESKEIFAYGRPDTVQLTEPTEAGDTVKITHTRPEFLDNGTTYSMDTVTYNLDTKKARIKGVATQEGEGYLQGVKVKKMPDNTVNIANGRYTTCDAEHPHFYMAMTKSKTIPGKKSIFGPSYFVMEDVPIYFLGLPFGFFPMSNERKSGILIPTFGEEVVKGFFLRDGGYYWAFGDHADLALTAGIYTLGSWEGDIASRYAKRYKYKGSIDLRYTKDVIGSKGDADYVNQNNFRFSWSHQQDAKFRPNSTFAASVNFSTSGYSKYGAQNLNEYLSSQTNSSISYSKSWAGTPFSLSANLQHSQNSRDSTIQLSFPNVVLNVSRVNPFRRKNAVGKQRWYEKISFTYTGTVGNTVATKEKNLFTEQMFKDMKTGINHQIPVQTSMNIFKYFNISPSFTYQERWYFRKIDKEWDPIAKQVVNSDTTTGFYRLYDYNMAVSASTKIYGTYQFKKGAAIQAIRHLMTPQVSFSYRPDFSKASYGYYKQVQSDTTGRMTTYSPFADGLYGVPGAGQNMSLNFSLTQSLEMKVRSKKDTSGVKKIKLIESFVISSSYNFLADSLKLQPFSLSLRTNLFKNVGLNVSASLDPYQVDATGRRINKFMLQKGKLGRLTSVSTTFGYSFNSSRGGNTQPAMNDINSGTGAVPPEYTDMFAQNGYNNMDPNTRRMMMASRYYDFQIPWNFGFNYSFSYTKPGLTSSIVQTLGFNGSVNLTQKWGLTFNGGYDFKTKKLTPGTITLTRDLHCWQMNFNWVPIGLHQSWSFTIAVKASTLKDLKYDRRNSMYDNLYDNW